MSKGENKIVQILKANKISFKREVTFPYLNGKKKAPLRFDFAIFDAHKLVGLIEFDGRQHFEPIEFFGGINGFIETVKRDKIKNTYCQTHNIPLLRLPYTLSTTQIREKIYKYCESLTTAGCA